MLVLALMPPHIRAIFRPTCGVTAAVNMCNVEVALETRTLTNAQLVRRARGLTQDEVAAAAGLTREALSRIERKYRVPSDAVRTRLAAVLDLDAADLLEAP